MKLFAGLLVLLATACAPFGDAKQAHRYYVLEPAGHPSSSLSINVGTATASSFYDTEAIAYSRSPGTRGYYQLHSWTEVPARRIGDVLLQRNKFSPDAPVLNLHLVEMYHDAASPPGTARVSLAAELAGKRKVFEASAAAATYDAPGAVKGFNEAVGKLLEEIESWVTTSK